MTSVGGRGWVSGGAVGGGGLGVDGAVGMGGDGVGGLDVGWVGLWWEGGRGCRKGGCCDDGVVVVVFFGGHGEDLGFGGVLGFAPELEVPVGESTLVVVDLGVLDDDCPVADAGFAPGIVC